MDDMMEDYGTAIVIAVTFTFVISAFATILTMVVW